MDIPKSIIEAIALIDDWSILRRILAECENRLAALAEQQGRRLDDICTETGNQVLMVSATEFRIIDANRRNLAGPYASHEQAALALISGAYTRVETRVETCVQRGRTNKVQWAKAQKQGHAAVMRGGSV